jgi:hypothetical protein
LVLKYVDHCGYNLKMDQNLQTHLYVSFVGN